MKHINPHLLISESFVDETVIYMDLSLEQRILKFKTDNCYLHTDVGEYVGETEVTIQNWEKIEVNLLDESTKNLIAYSHVKIKF